MKLAAKRDPLVEGVGPHKVHVRRQRLGPPLSGEPPVRARIITYPDAPRLSPTELRIIDDAAGLMHMCNQLYGVEALEVIDERCTTIIRVERYHTSAAGSAEPLDDRHEPTGEPEKH